MGNNDGTLNGKVVFQAKKNHAVFESADKVTVHLKRKDIAAGYKNQPIITVQESSTGNQADTPPLVSSSKLKGEKRQKSVKKNNPYPRRDKEKDIQSVGDEYEGLKVNTRVVYFEKNPFNPINGTLRFLGYLKKYDDNVYAVVETVRYQYI